MKEKTHNYFCAWDTINDKMLTCVHTWEEQDVWKDICEKYLDTVEQAKKFHKDPYAAMYKTDFKKYIEDVAPHILKQILYKYIIQDDAIKGYNPVNDDNVEIRLATSHDYALFNPVHKMRLEFERYFESEDAQEDKNQMLDFYIIEAAGFERCDTEIDREAYHDIGIEDYQSWKITKESLTGYGTLHITISNCTNNSNAKFGVHIDNADFCTVGSAEIDTIWQFNLLMNMYGINFIML